MTLSDIYTMLKSIPGFENKVAYRAFKNGSAPKLPYICYMATQTDNFTADNHVYAVIQGVDIELYTQNKDVTSEGLIESALNENHIVWEKYEDYIEDENCYMITYEVEV
jgi:hypothetical protein